MRERTAAPDLVAAALRQLIVDLYSSEATFRHWCNQQLWPSEVAALVEKLQQSSAQSDRSLQNKLAQLMQQAQLMPSEALEDPLTLKAASESRRLFLASANTGSTIGTLLNPEQPLPQAEPPFDLRVISLPVGLDAPTKPSAGRNNAALALQDAPPLPERSSLQLGQANNLDGFTLIRGEGPMEETLACFQMLAQQMKLPFRKDSIEKVLRDSLRRGQTPNIQLCGQLGASLGLHVVSAKVPATKGTRLQTPCMLQWNSGFALAWPARRAWYASPSQGEVSSAPSS